MACRRIHKDSITIKLGTQKQDRVRPRIVGKTEKEAQPLYVHCSPVLAVETIHVAEGPEHCSNSLALQPSVTISKIDCTSVVSYRITALDPCQKISYRTQGVSLVLIRDVAKVPDR